MQGKAHEKFLRIAPRKVRQVAELIRGKNADEAITLLRFTRKSASLHLEKAIHSAVANLMYLYPETEREKVVIRSVCIDGGPTLKRGRAASMGRRSMIRKRTSHITVTVEEVK